MQVIQVLLDKIVHMSEGLDLDSKTDHYYERGVVDMVKAREDIGITEAIDAITYLRSLIQEDS